MPYIAPPNIPSEKRQYALLIPNDRLFVGAVFGALETLTKPYNWEQDAAYGSVTPEEAAQAAQELLSEVFQLDCECISSIGFNPLTGNFFYTTGSGETVNIVNQNTVFNSSETYITTEQFADSKDIYCYAARNIAAETADAFQDMVELIDLADSSLVQPIVVLFNEFADLVPIIGDAAATVGQVGLDITNDILDYIRVNAQDADAISLLSEWVYCSLVSLNDANAGFDALRNELINQAGADLALFNIALLPSGNVDLGSLLTVVEFAYNTLNGENMAYPLLAWLLALDTALELAGQPTNLQRAIAKATRLALSSDGRDCAEFPCNACKWRSVWNVPASAERGWELQSFDVGSFQEGLGWSTTVNTTTSTERNGAYIRYSEEVTPTITRIVVRGNVDEVGNNSFIVTRVRLVGSSDQITVAFEPLTQTGSFEFSYDVSYTNVDGLFVSMLMSSRSSGSSEPLDGSGVITAVTGEC